MNYATEFAASAERATQRHRPAEPRWVDTIALDPLLEESECNAAPHFEDPSFGTLADEFDRADQQTGQDMLFDLVVISAVMVAAAFIAKFWVGA